MYGHKSYDPKIDYLAGRGVTHCLCLLKLVAKPLNFPESCFREDSVVSSGAPYNVLNFDTESGYIPAGD